VAGQRRLASRFVRQPRTQGGKWAFTVVVGHPRRQDPPQMPLVERNHAIETLAPGRLNESLAVAVALWRDDGEYDASSPSPHSPPAMASAGPCVQRPSWSTNLVAEQGCHGDRTAFRVLARKARVPSRACRAVSSRPGRKSCWQVRGTVGSGSVWDRRAMFSADWRSTCPERLGRSQGSGPTETAPRRNVGPAQKLPQPQRPI
jgi:hypothetical protein